MARVKEMPLVSSITAVGIRSMSADELPLLDREHTYFAQDLWLREDWIDDVVASLSQNVYITFDLDALDPAIMPSTGTPEPGGLGWYQTLHLLKKVAASRNIVGCDIVELCPSRDNKAPDFLAAKLVYKMLSYIFETASF
jgi:agmatinase